MRSFLFIVLLLRAFDIMGQPQPLYSFTHHSMLNGLVSNEVFSVAQDRTGYIWIATNNGLQRYDGAHYKTFYHQEGNPQSLPSNVIMQLLADATDKLWLVCHTGEVGYFNKSTFAYTRVPAQPQKAVIDGFGEKRLIKDEWGNLFLSIRGSDLLYYDAPAQKFVPISSFMPVKKEWGFTSLSQQPGTHKYWMGLQSGGLVIYNRKTGSLSYWGHNVAQEPAIEAFGPKSDFAYSFFDRQGRVWFHQWGAGFPNIMMYDPRRPDEVQQFELYSSLKTYHELHGFMQRKDGVVGLYGWNMLAFFNEAERKFNLIPNDNRNGQGINYESVNAMFEDREQNVWIATQEDGLYRFNPSLQFFQNVHHRNPHTGNVGEGSVMSFVETRNGDLLTGTWEDGPFRYTKDLKNIPARIKIGGSIKMPYIWSFCASADSNTIWMSAQPGLYRYDQAKGIAHFFDPPLLQHRTVRQVAEDKSGNLWLGMHAFGLYHWPNPKKSNEANIIKMAATGNAMINHIVVDRRNTVWVATGNNGLFAFDGKSAKLLQHWGKGRGPAGDKIGNSITALLEYNDSLVLIATMQDLFFYNAHAQTISRLRPPAAFTGNLAAVQRDAEGYIWIGTTNALYRIHPQKHSSLMFNRIDGMSSDRFNLSASYRMKNGRLLFGAANSFVSFYPPELHMPDAAAPAVMITDIQVGKTALRVDSVMQLDRLTLGYKDNSLAISFSPLVYIPYPSVQYKMEGIDEEWKTADRDFKASFPFLPAGRYTLLLRSLNMEGMPSDKPTSLHFYIKPPFYQTWWFYTLAAIGFALELYWLDRQRSLRKQSLQKMRTDISYNLHQEVSEALSNINILSEIARLKSGKEPQKAADFMEQIYSKSHNMIIAMDDMLWSLNPENDSMPKTISRIKEFADALMQRHDMVIELLIDKKVEKLQLNMKLRHEAFLLFKEGLRSLAETGTRHCVVHLTTEKAKLLLSIEFDNEGCDTQKLANLIQRRDMEARLQQLKAKLHVQLHKSKSIFSLQLPLV